MTVIEYAHAKINLGLKILDRRADDFHSILSIFQTVDLTDTLELSDTIPPGISCSDPTIPAGPDNLVLRAEAAVQKSYPHIPRLGFTLQKNIPVGAGLGGGSADAASALRGLDAFHHLNITPDELQMLASQIGSDVPFFLTGGTAVVSGRGEVVEPVEWPYHFTYVLVYPGFPISTAWAYNQLRSLGQNSGGYRELVNALKDGSIHREDIFKVLENDFETPVFAAHPVLAGVKQRLFDGGASAAFMSGSGSTMIGLFESESVAFHCADSINIAYGGQFSIFTIPAAG